MNTLWIVNKWMSSLEPSRGMCCFVVKKKIMHVCYIVTKVSLVDLSLLLR